MLSCDDIIVSQDTYREPASEIQRERLDDIPLLLGLSFLLFRSSLPESYELLKQFKFKYIFFAIALNGIDWLVGGLRIWVLSGAVHKELKFSSSFKVY
ncbi:hypothetical protein FJZ31_12880 [Candidatus Poribacteria bacterium]|nr:hypothetical protein [Candidatus Poribacteria bacterium]